MLQIVDTPDPAIVVIKECNLYFNYASLSLVEDSNIDCLVDRILAEDVIELAKKTLGAY
jgi:hypothetical protein